MLRAAVTAVRGVPFKPIHPLSGVYVGVIFSNLFLFPIQSITASFLSLSIYLVHSATLGFAVSKRIPIWLKVIYYGSPGCSVARLANRASKSNATPSCQI